MGLLRSVGVGAIFLTTLYAHAESIFPCTLKTEENFLCAQVRQALESVDLESVTVNLFSIEESGNSIFNLIPSLVFAVAYEIREAQGWGELVYVAPTRLTRPKVLHVGSIDVRPCPSHTPRALLAQYDVTSARLSICARTTYSRSPEGKIEYEPGFACLKNQPTNHPCKNKVLLPAVTSVAASARSKFETFIGATRIRRSSRSPVY